MEITTNLGWNTKWTATNPPITVTDGWRSTSVPLLKDSEFFRLRSGPSLTDFWSSNATWVADVGGLGHNFGFHALAIIRGDDSLWAYYITNYVASDGMSKSAVGRARSMDGMNWVPDGLVLDAGGAATSTYPSASQPYHATGQAESDGWSAKPGINSANFLVYGPYATNIPSGENSAKFRMLIDQRAGANDLVATIEVVSGAQTLATKQIRRNEFVANGVYQDFTLFFTSQPGQTLEFRTYWHAAAYIKQTFVAIAQGRWAFWDDRIASFCRVWKDDDTYFMVYEGAGQDVANFPGDIGLATSTNGLAFSKYSGNPILRHNPTGWEAGNIGTPSLIKRGTTWFLFYHGFDGTRANIGVATGLTLTNLVKYSENPVISVSPSTWSSGAVGIRSTVFQEGSHYYFTFEGSTDPPFDNARWSTGMARSTNLLQWEKFTGNPIIPQTISGYGFDAPELVRIYGTWFLYVRMSTDPDAPTKRFRLVPN